MKTELKGEKTLKSKIQNTLHSPEYYTEVKEVEPPAPG